MNVNFAVYCNYVSLMFCTKFVFKGHYIIIICYRKLFIWFPLLHPFLFMLKMMAIWLV